MKKIKQFILDNKGKITLFLAGLLVLLEGVYNFAGTESGSTAEIIGGIAVVVSIGAFIKEQFGKK